MIPPLLRAAWDQAEAQLYQVVMTQPELYQRAVVLVGRLSATLVEECAGVEALIARSTAEGEHGWPTADRVAAVAMLPVAGLDLDRVGRAACAMAGRRLVADQARAERVDRLATARQAALDWVVLEESGDPAGVAWAPYRRVEVRSDTGRGVLVSTEPDVDLVGVLHRVTLVEVDPESGELRLSGQAADGDDPLPDPQPDVTAREAAVSRAKSALDGSS